MHMAELRLPLVDYFLNALRCKSSKQRTLAAECNLQFQNNWLDLNQALERHRAAQLAFNPLAP